MKTKNYISKKIAFSIFGPKYYHNVKSTKIFLDFLIGTDYGGIYSQISKILSDDDIVIDIGANMGQYLMRLSKIIKKGKIICVEPVPHNVSALGSIKKLLNIDNAIIINKAIDNREGITTLTIPKINGIPITTQASLLDYSLLNDSEKEKLEVETTTIDRIAEELSLNKVNFIKIDAEGFDATVLKSGYQTVKKFKPLLLIEENCFQEGMNWLFELGYVAFKFSKNRLIIINTYEESLKFEGDTFLASKVQINNIIQIFNKS